MVVATTLNLLFIVFPARWGAGIYNFRSSLHWYDPELVPLYKILAPTYIAVVPTDPQTQAVYNYNTASCPAANQEYVLGATLELGTNPALDNDVDGTTCTVNCADNVYCIQP